MHICVTIKFLQNAELNITKYYKNYRNRYQTDKIQPM